MAVSRFWSVTSFCIKLTQDYLAFKFKMIKKFDRPIICLVGSHAFNLNSLPSGALIIWDRIFFHKIIPLWILILYRKMLLKVKIAPIWVDWQTPPFVHNGLHCGAPNIWVGNFFHKMDPLFNMVLCRQLLKILKIGPIWIDWQTPSFVHNGLHELAIFFIKWTPFLLRFCAENCWKLLKIGPFWAKWQTPHFS